MKDTLWSHGQSLAVDEASMVRAPGSTTDCFVKSASGQQLHYVKAGSKGGYACDSNCLAYKSTKICSHTVAAAVKVGSIQELVSSHKKKLKTVPNLTCIAEAGKPSNVGKKPRRKASTKRNVYYHAQKTCVAPNFRDFVPEDHISSSIPPAI